jgi:hypothetical protein
MRTDPGPITPSDVAGAKCHTKNAASILARNTRISRV